MATKEKNYISGGSNCCARKIVQYPCQSLLCAELDYDYNIIYRKLPNNYDKNDSYSSIELLPRSFSYDTNDYGKQLGNSAPCAFNVEITGLSNKGFRYSYCNKCDEINGTYSVYKLPLGHYQAFNINTGSEFDCKKKYENSLNNNNNTFKFSDTWFGYLCSTRTKIDDVCGYNALYLFLYLDSNDDIYMCCGIINRNYNFRSLAFSQGASRPSRLSFLRKKKVGSLNFPEDYNRIHLYNNLFNTFSNLNCLNIDNLLLDEIVTKEEFELIDFNQLLINSVVNDFYYVESKLKTIFVYDEGSFVDCDSSSLIYNIKKINNDILYSTKNLAVSAPYVKNNVNYYNSYNLYEAIEAYPYTIVNSANYNIGNATNGIYSANSYDMENTFNYPYNSSDFNFIYETKYERPVALKIKSSIIEINLNGVNNNECLECENINGKHLLFHYDCQQNNSTFYTFGGNYSYGICDDLSVSSIGFGNTYTYPKYIKIFVDNINENLSFYNEEYNDNKIICANCNACEKYFDSMVFTFTGSVPGSNVIAYLDFYNDKNFTKPIKYRYNLGTDGHSVLYEDTFEIENFTNLETIGNICNINEENLTSVITNYSENTINYDYKIPCVPEDYPCTFCYGGEPPDNIILNFPNNWKNNYTVSNCEEYALYATCYGGYPFYNPYQQRYRYGLIPNCTSCGIMGDNINMPVGDFVLSRSLFQFTENQSYFGSIYRLPIDLDKNLLVDYKCDKNNYYYNNSLNKYNNSCVWSYINNNNIKIDGYNKFINNRIQKNCTNDYTIITDSPDYNHTFCDYDLITFTLFPEYEENQLKLFFQVQVVKYGKIIYPENSFVNNGTMTGDWVYECDEINVTDNLIGTGGYTFTFSNKIEIPNNSELSTGHNYIGNNIVVFKQNEFSHNNKIYVDLKNINNLELTLTSNNECSKFISWGESLLYPQNGICKNAKDALDNDKELVCNYPDSIYENVPYEINKYVLGTGCSNIDGEDTSNTPITLSSL